MWWVVSVLLVAVLAISLSMSVPLGQRRLQAILRIVQISMAVLLTSIFIVLFGWSGTLLVLITLVAVMAVSHVRPIHFVSTAVYKKFVLASMPWIARQNWLDHFSERTPIGKKIGLETYDELRSVIDNAPFLRHDESSMLDALLVSRDMTARDCMIPIDAIKTISSGEVVGPLLLDELHRSRQTIFVVVDKADKIVGTVHLSHLIEMTHVSSNIKHVMQPNVLRVHPNVPLRQLIDTMVTQNTWLVIVNDGDDIGTITLEALTSTLLGKTNK
jgi:CBS domain containing-hemolysin-like protein